MAPRAKRPEASPALIAFAKAIERFHKHDWKAAEAELRAVIEGFPGEAEIAERARGYIRICGRFLAKPPAEPKTPDEHYQAGVLRLNDGRLDEAAAHFERILSTDGKSEPAHYALACAHALGGRRDPALKHLKLAIELNAENRIHAAGDPDFELLRDDPAFQQLLGPSPREIQERAASPRPDAAAPAAGGGILED